MLSRFLKPPKPAIPPDQRVYAVGDIHGRADLLEQLLEMLRHDDAEHGEANTRLIFLGDLIDRGPASREVVARVRSGVDWARTTTLMGNHEEVMLKILDGRSEMLDQWFRFGGMETLQSWGISQQLVEQGSSDDVLEAFREAVTQEERAWFARLRTSLRIGDYYFVHAGIRPSVPLEKQADEDRLWIREEFLKSRRNHGAVIVHGHSISQDVELRPNRIGLDTGAYFTGRLTAIGLQGQDRWLLSTDAGTN